MRKYRILCKELFFMVSKLTNLIVKCKRYGKFNLNLSKKLVPIIFVNVKTISTFAPTKKTGKKPEFFCYSGIVYKIQL
jgi:hypothetical protein